MNPVIKKQCEDFYTANKAAVDDLADYVGVPPMWMVALFYNESSLHPLAINSNTGAAGLNQMLPSTLAAYGITTEQFTNGGIAYQCSIMKKFFEPIRGIVKRAGDLYLYNFLPAAVTDNVSADYILGQRDNYDKFHGISKNQIYRLNSGLDYNADGTITRRDFWDGFEVKYNEIVSGNFFFRDLSIDFKTNYIAWLAAALLIAFITYIIFKL